MLTGILSGVAISTGPISAVQSNLINTSFNRSDDLDLASIVRACQAIAQEFSIDDLINTLAKITLETAGATRGLIFIKEGAQIRSQIEASYRRQFTATRQAQDMGAMGDSVSLAVLNYASRTRETVEIADCGSGHQFNQDAYFSRTKARSLVCVPLQLQSDLMGLLYLENELAAKAFTSSRLKTLGLLAAQGAISIRNIRHATDMRERVRLEDQLKAAQAVQTALLPSPLEIPGVYISTSYIAADETGGDWYGYQFDAAHNRLFIQIGDVTGHGIPSALVTRAVAGAISAAHALFGQLPNPSDEQCLELLVRAANEAVAQCGLKSDLWMTMGFVVINLNTGAASYHNAGHLPLYLKSTDRVQRLHHVSSPLGIVDEVSFLKFDFKPGDLLLMVTDGLVENGTAEPGRRRFHELKKLVAAARDDQELKGLILHLYQQAMGPQKATDDCTMVALKRVA